MFVLFQTEHEDGACVRDCAGLVGIYNTYEAADDVMDSLFEFYKGEGEEDYCYYNEFDACIATKYDSDRYHWFIFDADNPEWVIY